VWESVSPLRSRKDFLPELTSKDKNDFTPNFLG
jgi:hypothetical protein